MKAGRPDSMSRYLKLESSSLHLFSSCFCSCHPHFSYICQCDCSFSMAGLFSPSMQDQDHHHQDKHEHPPHHLKLQNHHLIISRARVHVRYHELWDCISPQLNLWAKIKKVSFFNELSKMRPISSYYEKGVPSLL